MRIKNYVKGTILTLSVLTSSQLFADTDANADLTADVKTLTQQIKQLQKNQAKLEAKIAAKANVAPQQTVAPANQQITVNSPYNSSDSKQPVLPSSPSQIIASKVFPRSFNIPGTNTNMKVFGALTLNGLYDLDHLDSYNMNARFFPIVGQRAPAVQPSGVRLHARNSFFGVETQTPTDFGLFRTYLSMNFFDPNTAASELNANRHTANLFQAYGSLGPFLAGQTFSNFVDVKAYPETIDGLNNAGITQIINPQVRYTYKPNNSTAFAVALENPFSDFTTTGSVGSNGAYSNTAPQPSNTATNINGRNRYPDLTASATTNFANGGEISLNGFLREIGAYNMNVANAAAPLRGNGNQVNAMSYGISASTKYMTFGKDNVLARYAFGRGLGRYVTALGYQGAIYNPITNRLDAPVEQAGYLGYQHWWRDNLRSNLIYGASYAANPTMAANSMNKLMQTGTVNLIWSPVPRLDTGLEYIYGERRVLDADISNSFHTTGYANRLELGVTFFF